MLASAWSGPVRSSSAALLTRGHANSQWVTKLASCRGETEEKAATLAQIETDSYRASRLPIYNAGCTVSAFVASSKWRKQGGASIWCVRNGGEEKIIISNSVPAKQLAASLIRRRRIQNSKHDSSRFLWKFSSHRSSIRGLGIGSCCVSVYQSTKESTGGREGEYLLPQGRG